MSVDSIWKCALVNFHSFIRHAICFFSYYARNHLNPFNLVGNAIITQKYKDESTKVAVICFTFMRCCASVTLTLKCRHPWMKRERKREKMNRKKVVKSKILWTLWILFLSFYLTIKTSFCWLNGAHVFCTYKDSTCEIKRLNSMIERSTKSGCSKTDRKNWQQKHNSQYWHSLFVRL